MHQVGSCGFDSIPADLGTLFVTQNYPKDGACTQIESFLSVIPGPHGMVGHATTWECVIHGLANVKDLVRLRREVNAPRIPIVGPALRAKGGAFFDRRLGAYAAKFPGADASVVKRSMGRLVENGGSPAQYAAYFTVRSKFWMALMGVIGAVVPVIAKFALGRKLLIRFPSLFTFGMFTHDGPTRLQMETCRFEMRFFSRGYSNRALLKENPEAKPDMGLEVLVSGPEPGYIATPIYAIETAMAVLTSPPGSIPTGVLTPAAALRNVSDNVFKRLNAAGCTFEVVSSSA